MNPEHVPVLVGAAEIKGDTGQGAGAEPRDLIAAAARRAAGDLVPTGRIDGITLTNTASWRYTDLAAELATLLGAGPKHLFNAPVGGQWPTRLLDAAAQRIATGRTRIEVVAGGEAQATVTRAMKSGIDVTAEWGWSTNPGGPPAFDPEQLGSAAMQAAGLVAPTRIYPLFEAALRHRAGLTVEAADRASATLYSRMAEVATGNPTAWRPSALAPDEILAVGSANRMVCEPYRLSMNAMPFVDQAAALILTDLATARDLGVPDDVIVHVWGGAGAEDDPDVLARPSFAESRALAAALSGTLSASGLRLDDLDIVDVYSCFPVVPKLVLEYLGLPDGFVPTVTGGHSSFGGPLSSYSLHSLAAVYRRLSGSGTDQVALVHANGGYLTYQHCTLLSQRPGPRGFVGNPDPVAVHAADRQVVAAPADGEVTVETATVEYGRDGQPRQAFLVARTDTGTRVAAQTAPGDLQSARTLSVYHDGGTREIIGRRVCLGTRDDGFVTVAPDTEGLRQ